MIHYLKNGLILSNWVQVGYSEDWIKHRLGEQSTSSVGYGTLLKGNVTILSPVDMIKLIRMASMIRGNPGSYYVTFQGDNTRYIEETYRNAYGSNPVSEKDIEHLKSTIDAFLSKIDKLLPFA